MDRKVLPKTIHGIKLTRTQEVAREVASRLPGSGNITSDIVTANA